jgi:lipopolysaccharide export system protein LptA
MKKICLFICLIFAIQLKAQTEEMIRVTGDSLVGKSINGESIREVYGNVVITQGAVLINCNKAIQNINKNNVELAGNVVVNQDSIIIKTPNGFYDGNNKIASSVSGVNLTDGHINLTAKKGYYYFNEKRSSFLGDVKLVDALSVLKSNSLSYYDDEDKALADGNVTVADTSTTLFADQLTYFRQTKDSYASGNIRAYNPKNFFVIFGDSLIDQKSSNYSKITGNSFLVKIDTSSTVGNDTLYIAAKSMEAYSDSTELLIASDSVKIVRGDFSSLNDKTYFYRESGLMKTNKEENSINPPILWSGQAQLVGDSVTITLVNKKLDSIDIKNNSSIITASLDSLNRFDQISGKNIILFFNEGKLERSSINGNALSIYYFYEDGEPNGLLKASSENAKMFFEENKVIDVRFYKNAISEYHPENLVAGNEKSFVIPTFKIYEGKPAPNFIYDTFQKYFEQLKEDNQFNVER